MQAVPATAAFNVIQLEHAEAIVAGAEAAGLPVVLQISENAVKYHGALAPIAAATLAVARAASVDVAVHLDHAESESLVAEAFELGFTSVMFDASKLSYADNVARTRAIAGEAAQLGVWLEAELGEIGGKDGAHAPGVRTDVAEASEFVAQTGVNGLAVAVGSSHAMTSRSASLDFELIRSLADAVPVPLVLHGSSGVSDADIRHAVERGMRKVNIATHLNVLFTESVRATLDANPTMVDTRKYLGAARDVVETEVARLVRLISGS
nr:class II fructose-bisphosphate aldolase [Lysinibacter cavernae]